LKLEPLDRTVPAMTDTTATTETTETTETTAATSVPVSPAVDASLMAAAPAEAAAPQRPDALPETYWDADTNAIKPEAFSRLAELEAADVARREGLPETADKYELKLGEDIVGLDGKPVQFDPTDPLAQAVLPVLHECGVPQAGVEKLLAAFTKLEVEAAKAEQAHVVAEQAKLGSEHVKRTGAIHSSLVAAVGADAANALRQSTRSADAVIALEALVSKLTGAAISAAPPAAGASSYDETIAELPVEQRLAAARAIKAG
jgi:hypothetical protein